MKRRITYRETPQSFVWTSAVLESSRMKQAGLLAYKYKSAIQRKS